MSADDDPKACALRLIQYIDASPTAFHAVAEAMRQLDLAGFARLDEGAAWTVEPGGAYYVTRGAGSLIAWREGPSAPTDAGFSVVGAHTDSANLKLKTIPAVEQLGYVLLDVEVYGSPVIATWADRDLGLAGQVMIEEDGRLVSRLIDIDRPIARLANVAIHLNRKVNEDGLVLDLHSQLRPIVAMAASGIDPSEQVLDLIAGAAGTERARIYGHELCLYDLQKGSLAGLDEAFVQVSRLDNLASCHGALEALLTAPAEPVRTAVVGLFDHEEVGSGSTRGADGTFLGDVLRRLAGSERDSLPRAMTKSLQISADMAHAAHPAFGDKHDGVHLPRLGGGPVVKTNVNQRYATDAATGAQFRRICKDADVPFQEFVSRADLACGGTIGPISAARVGLPTVDVGNPILSMHSIREMAGARDHALMIRAMRHFFTAPPK